MDALCFHLETSKHCSCKNDGDGSIGSGSQPRASVVMVETTPAAIGDGVQQPAVLAFGWRQVASAAEDRAAEAASAMAEAMMVAKKVTAAAAERFACTTAQHGTLGEHPRHSFVWDTLPPFATPSRREMHILTTCTFFVWDT